MDVKSKLERLLDDYMHTPLGGGLHDKLMGIAHQAYKERQDCRDACGLEQYLRNVMQQRFGVLDADGERDCKGTAENCVRQRENYATRRESIDRREQAAKADYSAERKEWRELQGDPKIELYDKVKEQDVRPDRISCRQAVASLFRNVSGHVWHGATEAVIEKGNWIDVEKLATELPYGSKYISTCTFGDAKGEGDVYERKNDNVNQVACVLLEIDKSIDGTRCLKSDDVRALPEAERRAYRDAILKDTCLIVDWAKLKPTTITFSGGKSYHVLIRLATPVDGFQWHAKLKKMKEAYDRLGADKQVLTLSRCTRMPVGCRQDEARIGDCQRIVYFDPAAEMELDDIVSSLTALADRIAAVKPDPTDIHCPVFSEVNAKGETKWHKSCEDWKPFCVTAGVTKINGMHGQHMIVRDATGIYREMSPQQMADYLAQYVEERKGAKDCAHFVDLYGATLAKNTLEVYTGIVRNLNEPKDSATEVYAPFRNGLLVISKDDLTLKPDYNGYDIRGDSPTIGREWDTDFCKGEFETFVDRACGCEEDAPQWKDRKKSIVTLIGYLVCRHKESTNPVCLLTEESIGEDNGRTGKGLIASCIKYWRRRRFVNCKGIIGEGAQRFLMSGLKDSDEYMQFDDVRKGMDWQLFYTYATDDWDIEKKGKNKEVTIPLALAPKMVATSNFFPKGKDDSQEARLRIVEISNHYTARHTPEMEFGHRLFDDWDEDEWKRFDTFIARCVATYLRHGYIPYVDSNIDYKTYMRTVPEFIREWFEDDDGLFRTLKTYHQGSKLIDEYRTWYVDKHGVQPRFSFPVAKSLSKYIELACKARGLDIEHKQTAAYKAKTWRFKDKSDPSWGLSVSAVSADFGRIPESETSQTVENQQEIEADFGISEKSLSFNIEKKENSIYNKIREYSVNQNPTHENTDSFFFDAPDFAESGSSSKPDGFIDGVGCCVEGSDGCHVLRYSSKRPKPRQVPIDLNGENRVLGYSVCDKSGNRLVVETDGDGVPMTEGWTVEDGGSGNADASA